tara:strand:- start:351 stop:566 length:216 start_codon:yes stop_codon:yes gene_type:complete
MTKKDYIKIANIIKGNMREQVGYGKDIYGDTIYDIQHPDRNNMINELCDYFKKDNPNFNEMKFKNYIKEGK